MAGLNKVTVDDINVKGKKVLVRVDFNVPLDENKNITDETRINAALPTIKYLLDNGAAVILCSHLGKPKGEPKPALSLAPVAKKLSEKLGKEVVPLLTLRPQLVVCVRFAHLATAFEHFGCAHARTIRAHARALWACSLIAVAS